MDIKKILNAMIMKLLCVALIIFFAAKATALRDIFNLSQQEIVVHPLMTIPLEDLHLLGVIIGSKTSLAFVEDNLGNIYQIHLGQQIGLIQAKVVKILPTEILLLHSQEYFRVK